MATDSQSMPEQAAQVVRRRQKSTVRGVELACQFLGPIVRAAHPSDPRILAAVEALEAACAVRRQNKRRRSS